MKFHLLSKRLLQRSSLFVVFLLFLLHATTPIASAVIVVQDYPVAADARPLDITMGPDGNLWFTETGFGQQTVGRINPDGTGYVRFPLNNPNGGDPRSIVSLDGHLWVTETFFQQIAQITTDGNVSHHAAGPGEPVDLTVGPDGALWFTVEAMTVGRMTTGGSVNHFPKVGGGVPIEITSGPDGNLWYTVPSANVIGKMGTDGTFIQEYTVPTANSFPFGIVAGPDGNMWFTERDGSKIGKVTTDGVFLDEYPTPTTNSGPLFITAAPDGNLWFTENSGNKIGMITVAGVITEYSIPTSSSGPAGITPGPSGSIWFAENPANKIGVLADLALPPIGGPGLGSGSGGVPGAPNTGFGANYPDPVQTLLLHSVVTTLLLGAALGLHKLAKHNLQ